MVRKRRIQYGLYFLLSMIMGAGGLRAHDVDDDMMIEIFLDQSPYAQMLKELICMTDAIGLLKHTKIQDERRFIEDSILGKMVRANRLLPSINTDFVPPEDIDYLRYWLEIAQKEDLSYVLLEELCALDDAINNYFSHDEG